MHDILQKNSHFNANPILKRAVFGLPFFVLTFPLKSPPSYSQC